MTPELDILLRELEQFGESNDASASSRQHKMLNITRETGEFLQWQVRALKSRRILEIGTSNGYSTIWLALAAQGLKSRVTTLDILAHKQEMARANLEKAKLSQWVQFLLLDASEFMRKQFNSEFDFIFLDSERESYVSWWGDLRRILMPGGVIVVDNAISHAAEMQTFVNIVRNMPGFLTTLIPIGKGELVILKL
ncbi:MAG: O-methyltransferase [Chloroflexi bacterium]|jgi:predicted O-methyltransferase YrrM|nr:O-methyltransferase [Chloroflexota bacterium]